MHSTQCSKVPAWAVRLLLLGVGASLALRPEGDARPSCQAGLAGSVGLAAAAELCRMSAKIDQLAAAVDFGDVTAHGT